MKITGSRRVLMITGCTVIGWATGALSAEPLRGTGWPADASFHPVEVYRSGSEGYNTARIPSLVVTRAGTLLAFAEGRRGGGGDAGDIDVVVKRSRDGGATWSSAQVVWDDGGNTCGNPTPVVDQTTGQIWLALTWNLGTETEHAIMEGTTTHPRRLFLTHSDDDGMSWVKPVEMPHLRREHWRWYATGPDKGIQLTRGAHAGRLIIPCNHSDHSDPDRHPYRSHVVYSDDHGQTWQLGGALEEKTNESTIVELSDGAVMDNMRSYHGQNRRAVAISRDGGQSWGPVSLDEALIEPVCQASLLRYSWAQPDGISRILFANPAAKSRQQLTLRVSYDEGKTWPVARELYADSAAYSCLARLPDGSVGVLFEQDKYQKITFVAVPITWLEAADVAPATE